MGKLKDAVKSEEAASREKYITWSDESTKFMLEWYIKTHKDKPTTFVWKQHHHLQCADALNGMFGLGATRSQVYRHFRSCKEKWSWIRLALGKSGYGFDAAACKFNIDPSEKDPKKLGTAKYNYLTRPIKFFHLLEELFINSSQADGSLALDQSNVNALSDSDDTESVQELENYPTPGEDGGNDSDTIARSSPTTDGSSSVKKRKREKSPAKKPSKDKASRKKITNDDISASIVRLADSLTSSNPVAAPVQNNASENPHAKLWKRIEDLAIPAKDKLEIASYLSRQDQDNFRSYLSFASDATFGAWVIEFLDRKYSGGGEGFSSL